MEKTKEGGRVMKKVTKPYLVNLTEVERAFVEEMAWRKREKLSEYFRRLINVEMQKNPTVMQAVMTKMSRKEE